MIAYPTRPLWPSVPAPAGTSRGAQRTSATVRRCHAYRGAFRGAVIAYPAAVLRSPDAAGWIRRTGATVDVTSVAELDDVRSAGVAAERIVMHRGDRMWAPIRCASNAGVKRFVLDSSDQVGVLSVINSVHTRQISLDVSHRRFADIADIAEQIASHQRMVLVGLHIRVDDDDVRQAVGSMIGAMARLRQVQGLLLTRLSIAGFNAGPCDTRSLSRLGDDIDDALEDGCIRYRFPRPMLTLTPAWSMLTAGSDSPSRPR
jgi:diaminopimelate decarboxylase